LSQLDELYEITPDILVENCNIFLRKDLPLNKYLLVSWRMSGSEFSKEFIRENFPELALNENWAKAHIVLDADTVSTLKKEAKTRVFVVITDPREVAMNIGFYENGLHISEYDYKLDTHKNINTSEFLNQVAQKQIDLIRFYKKEFGDDCIVLRYEDAVFNQTKFLKQVSDFTGLTPLYVDDARKYKWSIHKNVGDFHNFFTRTALTRHYLGYKKFYKEYNYPEKSLQNLKYDWHGTSSVDRKETNSYHDMLVRNGVTLDREVIKRIKSVDEY
jgi:hypothetical protein